MRGNRDARQLPVAWFASLAAILFLSSAVLAEPTNYVLVDPSDFQDGCQEGCACPVLVGDLVGSFVLTPLGPDGEFEVFDITAVHWTIFYEPPNREPVTGSGTFRVRQTPEPLQRLELDLVIGDGAPVHFDSGLVPVQAEFPRIGIAIAMNGFYCYDNVFVIHAVPEDYTEAEATTWGRVKSLYGP